MKTFIIFFLIAFFAFFSRVYLLNLIPTGITPDELDYILTSKSIFLTGSDMSGTWNPLSFTTPPFEYPKAELPYLLISPFIGVLPLSPLTSKLPYVLLNIILIFTIFAITKKLLNEKVGIIALLLMIINPWSFYFGRTAYEAMIAITFYFIAFYILLFVRKWHILFSFPFLFIAFYSYIGTKLILLPFVAIVCLYAWLENKKKYSRYYIMLLLLCVVTFVFFIVSSYHTSIQSRAENLLLPTSETITKAVDLNRKTTIPTVLTPIFENKITEYVKNTTHLYVGAFSPYLLFTDGEYTPFINIRYGFFYLIDAFFLIIGFILLFKKRFKIWILLTALTLIAPFPAVFSQIGTSYGLRSSLLFPLLIIFISFGIYELFNLISKRRLQIIFAGGAVSIYSIFFAHYLFIYFMQFPIYGSEPQGFNDKVLIRYLTFAQKENKKVIVIENVGKSIPSLYKQFLFYTNGLNKNTADKIKKSIITKDYVVSDIHFSSCPTYKDYKNAIVVKTNNSKCSLSKSTKSLSITRLSDSGEVYSISNDAICNDQKLPRFVTINSINDFDVNSLSKKEFCEKFIVSYN